MQTFTHVLALSITTMVSASACKQTETSSASTKSETAPKPAAPAQVAPPPATPATPTANGKVATCPPDFKNADPAFCIKLPAGATAGEPTRYESSGNISFSDGVTVSWYPLGRYDEQVKSTVDKQKIHDNATNLRSGDTLAGGKFTAWKWGDQFHVASVVKGSKLVLACDVGALDEHSPDLDACLSLKAD